MPANPSSPSIQDTTPLLANGSGKEAKHTTPLPRLQISILLLAIFLEPVAAQCIYPFINQLVSELDITGGDDRKVGKCYYAGLIESIFFVTQAVTVLQWSRISDRIGRKPVLLIGIFGTSLSTICFGLSRTFTSLVLRSPSHSTLWSLDSDVNNVNNISSRCITGALNGNIGVTKSILGDLTDSTNMAQGFALMPLAWSLGNTVGPVLGGTLARPQDHFPAVFSDPFWEQFPYFLPCGIAAAYAVLTFTLVLFFLRETLNSKSSPERLGLRVNAEPNRPETGYNVLDQEGGLCAASTISETPSDTSLPLRQLLTPCRVIIIANYAMLATLDIVVYALQSLFYATSIENGGLGFTPMTIGLWIACLGIADGFVQAVAFSALVDRVGPKKLFRIGHACFVPIFALFPLTSWLARRHGITWLVWVLLSCQFILEIMVNMAYSCIMMYITASAPNKRSLGALNGAAQMTASIARAIGPALSTSMFAYSVEHNLVGGYAVWLVMVLATFGTATMGMRLPEEMGEGE
ncbi:major facilitator superfamily domain-containing protein [Phlebopus sp. FC_14]|nr:major facilitator superfamily domain-containing protein [Phlebopus sp. FC_14]